MSQYGTEYRLEFATVPVQDDTGEVIASQNIRCSIFDTENLIPDADTPLVINLQGSGNPLHISTINDGVDKEQPIRSKQAAIEFLSDINQALTAATFADSSDNRWLVKIVDGASQILFWGFIVLADVQQAFQPDPQVVILTCSDHLGILKDIPFSLDDGTNPQGKYRLAEIMALCLKKTGLSLPITAINNLRHGSGQNTIQATFNGSGNTISPLGDTSLFYIGQRLIITGTSSNNITTTVIALTPTLVTVADTLVSEFQPLTIFTDYSSTLHFYDAIYEDALTYEDQIGTCINCYDVLSWILGEDCFICQWLDRWYIYRVDEFDDNPTYPASFDQDGTFVGFLTSTTYAANIGAAQPKKFALADCLRNYDRPNRFVKETFKFETPLETPCNSDYSRGAITLDPDVQLTGYTAYTLDCWEIWKEWGVLRVAADVKTAIHRSFNDLGDELTRYIMITGAPSLGATRYIRSSGISIGLRDRFTLSFDVAAIDSSAGDGSLPILYILLYGNDGTVWVLVNADHGSAVWGTDTQDISMKWLQTNADFSLFRVGLFWNIHDSADFPVKTDWLSVNVNGIDCPVDGEIRLHFMSAGTQSGSFDDFRIKYQNIQFQFRAYIGGSYAKYTGQYQQVTRNPVAGYFANRDKQVYMSDSPKPYYKGAMWWYDTANYHLANRFYAANPFYTADPPLSLGTPPNFSYSHRYGYIQAFSVWNQFKNGNRKFDGTVLGLGQSWVDLVSKVTLSDNDPDTNNRYFMLISFDQNWRTGQWKAVFVEVFNTLTGHVYTDDQVFKYITE